MRRSILWINLIFLFSVLGNHQVDAQDSKTSAIWWNAEVSDQLARAGANDGELTQALRSVSYEHREALEFLIQYMPESDLKSLTADYLLENVKLAYQGINQVPWGKTIPTAIFLNDVLPYANVDETRESWRKEMLERCLPLVKDCQSPGEAAQKLNRELFGLVKVRYSTSRKRANQSPSESIEQGVASCTGLSIILADACRSVGVPARLVGTPSWTNKRGNHTWVEVWNQGWQFTGAAEPSAEGLNRGWFENDASFADDSKPMNRIYATSYQNTGIYFPMVWSKGKQSVPGVNVTPRYTAKRVQQDPNRTRVLITLQDAGGRRLEQEVVLKNQAGEVLKGRTRGESADTNDILMFDLPRNQTWKVSWEIDGNAFAEELATENGEQTWWRLKSSP